MRERRRDDTTNGHSSLTPTHSLCTGYSVQATLYRLLCTGYSAQAVPTRQELGSVDSTDGVDPEFSLGKRTQSMISRPSSERLSESCRLTEDVQDRLPAIPDKDSAEVVSDYKFDKMRGAL